MVWTPTPPATIPNEETILALLTRSGTDPASGYITPADIATAWQAFMSRDYWGRSGRNRIINGAFDIWQRGGGPFASTGGANYCADQVKGWATGSTITSSRQAFAVGNVIPGYEAQYFLRSVAASVAGAGNNCTLVFPMEGARTFAGQPITVSFYAKADAAKPISISLEQSFGAGGSASVQFGATKLQLTTAWVRYTVTVTVPAITGKTVGTANDVLNLLVWLEAGSNNNANTGNLGQQSGTFDFWGVQIEAGNVATSFEHRPVVDELARCQRYFCSTFWQGTTPAVGTGDRRGCVFGQGSGDAAGFGSQLWWPFPVTMRTVPTVTTYNPVSANANGRDFASNTDLVAQVDSNYIGSTGCGITLATPSGSAGHRIGVHATASAEL